MSALTKRSALVLELAQLDATECQCGHPLKSHVPMMRGPQTSACRYWDFNTTRGAQFNKQQFCGCKEFREPAVELPLGTK